METGRSSVGEKVVSIVVMIWAAGWLAHYSSSTPEDWVALGVKGFVGIGGVAVAFAVWQARRGAMRMYAAWAIADALALVLLDARVEPEWWKVGLAGLLSAAVLSAFGFGLATSRRRRLSSA